MKKLLLAFLSVILVAGIAIADDNYEDIAFKDVPGLGQKSVEAYFSGNTVVRIVKYTSGSKKRRTCVVFESGAAIEFDKNGNWMIVDCINGGSVPMRMVPGLIQMYLSQNNPDTEVVLMSRERLNGVITILLNDGTELQFTD